ncbi:hypothetical protein MM213_14185 [Belliella sp. R4-6]|uniref:Uncharacterized protein n=1 Tax=Belliella alkalica TaxID=1730871 RepID=A0ABS9VF43_9BACT|nr:hypothetical protein [Belliella alkalica]MCH7414645.1 hypothetical protein [Belliella alkalica]
MWYKINSFFRKIARVFTLDGFALSSVWVQLTAIFLVSAILIFGMSVLIGDLSMSYRLFADPSSYANLKLKNELVFGLIQVLLGLVLFSFIISVLSAALIGLIEKIKSGTLPFNKKGHILFVNYNIKLPMILDEFDIKSFQDRKKQRVVLLFPDTNTVTSFRLEMDKGRWPNLQIYLRQGDLLSFQTYQRQGIFQALGLVILLPDNTTSTLEADNFNLKLLTNLVNNKKFFNYLNDRHLANQPVKCLLELSANKESSQIAKLLTASKVGNLFAVTTPSDVIGSVMSRAMVDMSYYNIFYETLSFAGARIHFVDPKRFKKARNLIGKSFHELLMSFSGGSLIGFSGAKEGRLNVQLCPFSENLGNDDWLIFLTGNIKSLNYQPHLVKQKVADMNEICAPSELISKDIAVIGNTWPIGNIEDFIDYNSFVNLNKSHHVFDSEKDYFQKDFLNSLVHSNHENIVINLQDDLAFRISLILANIKNENIDFKSKIITLLGDPTVEQLIREHTDQVSTVLSHQLAARYIAQLSFQKNLESLFSELAFAEGSEFNILEVGEHISEANLKNSEHVKSILAEKHLIYVGAIDRSNKIQLSTNNFNGVKQILVLSRGSK